MMHMKRYSILLILVFAAVITVNGQVEERFKTKPKDSSEEQNNQPQGTDEPRSSTNKDSNASPGQQPKEEKFFDKVVIGGSASLSFGTTTYIYLAPTVGYKFSDNLVAGPGFIYQYIKFNEVNYGGVVYQNEFESSVYGPKAFFNYLIADRFFTGAHFEYLNHTVPDNVVAVTTPGVGTQYRYEYRDIWTPVLFLEVGLMSRIGSKGFAQIGLRYNVLHEPDTSPYASAFFPVIAFYF